jgi:ATP-dependent Clp protease ATP-binding subunit ClpA
MRDYLDNFSDSARHALALADSEAEALAHPRIGSEHLLLGLLGAEEGLAYGLLASSGIELERMRRAVLLTFGRGVTAPAARTLTPHTRRALKMAIQIAYQRGDRLIETEHLLLALLEVDSGRGAGILDLLGVHAEELQQRVIEDLRERRRSEKASAVEPSDAVPSDGADFEKLITHEMAELRIALRAATRSGSEIEIASLERQLNDATVRRLDARRTRIVDLLIDYERRRLALETNTVQAERELDRLEEEIKRRNVLACHEVVGGSAVVADPSEGNESHNTG